MENQIEKIMEHEMEPGLLQNPQIPLKCVPVSPIYRARVPKGTPVFEKPEYVPSSTTMRLAYEEILSFDKDEKAQNARSRHLLESS